MEDMNAVLTNNKQLIQIATMTHPPSKRPLG